MKWTKRYKDISAPWAVAWNILLLYLAFSFTCGFPVRELVNLSAHLRFRKVLRHRPWQSLFRHVSHRLYQCAVSTVGALSLPSEGKPYLSALLQGTLSGCQRLVLGNQFRRRCLLSIYGTTHHSSLFQRVWC